MNIKQSKNIPFDDLISNLTVNNHNPKAIEHFIQGLNDPLFFDKIDKAKNAYKIEIKQQNKDIQAHNKEMKRIYDYFLNDLNSDLHKKWLEEYNEYITINKRKYFNLLTKKILYCAGVIFSLFSAFLCAYLPYIKSFEDIFPYFPYFQVILSILLFTFSLSSLKEQFLDRYDELPSLKQSFKFNYQQFINAEKCDEKRAIIKEYNSKINLTACVDETIFLKKFFNYKPMIITYLFLKHKTNDISYNTQLASDLFSIFQSQTFPLNTDDFGFDNNIHFDKHSFSNIYKHIK